MIFGNLICKEILSGGGKIYSCPAEKVDEWFDTEGACIVHGDIRTGSFLGGRLAVVVAGSVTAEGGGDGEQ